MSGVALGEDLYATLGVAPSATTDEIGAAFRARAKELHPDRRPGDEAATERFKALTNAYDVLTRPASRDAYDRRRAGQVRAAASGPSAGTGRPAHAPLFRTPGRARGATWAGLVLIGLGVAAGVVLAMVPTGDAAKAITLWIVVAKLLVCGAVLAVVGRWRLHRLRSGRT